eukprot:bmy_09990T0
MPMYNFPQSPPAQYSPMHNMGLLPMHPLQIPAPSWPIHGPVIHSAPGSAPSNIGLNDPSIIFAQPAARPVAIPSSSHDGHWPRTVAPNSLVNNGTVGNSGNPSFSSFVSTDVPPVGVESVVPTHQEETCRSNASPFSFSWSTDAQQPANPAVSRVSVPQCQLHSAEKVTFNGKQNKSGPDLKF